MANYQFIQSSTLHTHTLRLSMHPRFYQELFFKKIYFVELLHWPASPNPIFLWIKCFCIFCTYPSKKRCSKSARFNLLFQIPVFVYLSLFATASVSTSPTSLLASYKYSGRMHCNYRKRRADNRLCSIGHGVIFRLTLTKRKLTWPCLDFSLNPLSCLIFIFDGSIISTGKTS